MEPGPGPPVLVESQGDVRVVVLDRPPVNAVDLTIVSALENVFAELAADGGCKAVVVTGRPGVFCAGIDTRVVPSYDGATRAAMLRAVNRTIRSIYGLPKPVVAALSGHALGAGLVLAIASDYRVVARGEFKLGLTEAAAGIPFPAGPLAVCRAELSAKALRVLALGSGVHEPDADEVAELVDAVVETQALRAAAVAEARKRSAVTAYGRVKCQLRSATIARLDQIVEHDDEPLLGGWI